MIFAAVLERGERAISSGAESVLRGRVRKLQATAAFWLADYAVSRGYAQEAVARLPQGSAEWFLALGEAVSACGRLADMQSAERYFHQAVAATADADAGAAQVICLSRACFPLIQGGRHELVDPVLERVAKQRLTLPESEALALAQTAQVQAETLLNQLGSLERGQSWPPLVLIECLLANGNRNAACKAAEAARRRLLQRASRIEREELRQSFLALFPHERTLALAKELLDHAGGPIVE